MQHAPKAPLRPDFRILIPLENRPEWWPVIEEWLATAPESHKPRGDVYAIVYLRETGDVFLRTSVGDERWLGAYPDGYAGAIVPEALR